MHKDEIKKQLISDIMCLPPTAIEYHLGMHLAKLFPEKVLLEGDIGYFNVEGYAKAGLCKITRHTFLFNQVTTYWQMPEPEMLPFRPAAMIIHRGGMIIPMASNQEQSDSTELYNTRDTVKKAWLEIEWESNTLDVILLHWDESSFHKSHYWMLTASEEVARRFLAAVCQWNAEVRSEVLVFDNGCWHKDEHLFQDIKNATFDNLILHGTLKQDLRDDLVQFFAAREIYEEYGIPWKRGILFVGPPGNGKTHAVKALINSMEQPCLYVKSFRSPHGMPDDVNIRQVFERARRTSPCILVLEDLDALVTPENRSFFLNELDGFAANIGIVALATTNHPERLDPAILDRPSRFDRKYPFDLPALAERRAYIDMWNASLKPQLRLSEEGATKLSELTEDFSFAYLKELFLSSMMRWIANPQQGTMETVMVAQVEVLREQMVSANSLPEPELPDADPRGAAMVAAAAAVRRRYNFRKGR
jgi:AAA+ superfamily predicted ATPase